MQNRSQKTLPVFVLLIVVVFMGIACPFPPLYARDEKTNNALVFFSRVLEELKKNYVDEPDPDVLVRHAIQGMMESLDPYSVYLLPEAFDALKDTTQGGFCGIGMGVVMVKNRLTVVFVSEGTPAHRAQIKIGDRIIKIDDDSTAEMTFRDCVFKIKGPEGSKVRITLVRESLPKPFTCELTREFVIARSVQSAVLNPKGIGYIAVRHFRENTVQDLINALEGLETFGKGSVQTVIPFKDGSGIKYTVARYYTPNNQSIQDRGVIPDIEVAPGSDFFLQEEIIHGNGREMMDIDLLKKDTGIARALLIFSEKGIKK